MWWYPLLIPEAWRQRQVDPWEFEASLVYSVNSGQLWRATQRNPIVKNKNKTRMKERGEKKRNQRGWGDGSRIKSTVGFSRGSRFSSHMVTDSHL